MGEKLCQETILAALDKMPISVCVLPVIDSTNEEAKRRARNGASAPLALLAEEQTAGRGRVGRSFYSPPDTGLYLSLLLRPNADVTDTVGLTTLAAVAAMRAIRTVTGVQTQIKWVNDLYAQGKKVCGILAESFFADDIRYVVIGVGINLYTSEFPAELADKAGGLLVGGEGLRNALAARTIAELYELATGADRAALMREYRSASMVLGKAVVYTQNGIEHRGVAESIDDAGRLCVRLPDGSLAILASGEISLRRDKSCEKHNFV